MGDAAVKPADAETPAQSFPQRLLGVFISPTETFADVARKPDFVLPLVLLVLLEVAGVELFLHKIGMEPILKWALEHSTRTANMAPDQIQGLVEKMVPYYAWMARVFGILWIPLVVLVGAVVGLVTVNSIFGGRITFKVAFSISTYAYTVNIIHSLIALTMTMFGDTEHFISNPQNPTPTSAGFFLNPVDTSKPVLALAGSLEIFTLWNMALLAVGLSVASGRKAKVTPVFFIILGLWIVMVLIKTGLATFG
jgi:ABC-type multidrug transport system fused ATPase/permease subunit